MCYVAFSRIEDNFSNMSVPTGYKVKSREGCVYPMSLSKCPGVRTQASTVLPGRVGTSSTENQARPAHGQLCIHLLLCWQPALGRSLVTEGRSDVTSSCDQLKDEATLATISSIPDLSISVRPGDPKAASGYGHAVCQLFRQQAFGTLEGPLPVWGQSHTSFQMGRLH